MTDEPSRKTDRAESPGKRPEGVTLPPIDASPEEIAQALFKPKSEGETEKPA